MFTILQRIALVLVSISISSTTYLYQYPFFHGCGFPHRGALRNDPASLWENIRQKANHSSNTQAPFRLLALGDPQLEGDTSLPDREAGIFASLRLVKADLPTADSNAARIGVLKQAVKTLVSEDIPIQIGAWRKQLDLFGNDYYLAHIYRTIYQHTNPTHVTVLGDLLGSQWIDDEEFEMRGARFWQRVFHKGNKVEHEITDEPTVQVLGEDEKWARRIINIAGNHDVGYAGDMTVDRVERFDRVFGKPNWEITFRLPQRDDGNHMESSDKENPELRIVVLNSLNLDTPATDEDLQKKTYDFINEIITRSKPVEDRTVGTVLLTHIPLHKEVGICVDSPFFDFHSSDQGGGLKEQNHISYNAGKGILEGIFGMSGNLDAPGRGLGRNGIIVTGHDHEGCDVCHHLPFDEDIHARRWNATKWHDVRESTDESIPEIREITVRSMMGNFGGNAGLLSAWFDHQAGEWRFAYSTCSAGVQHIWWAVHVTNLVTIGFLTVTFLYQLMKVNLAHSGKSEAPNKI
ncbi:hypothetical protein MMC14_003032 [Varicellaria rhodocarpa]|nr:hypothetical protein [Varicellaria rhodocarpa]